MWVKTRAGLVNLDLCTDVYISDFYFKNELPKYTLIATKFWENGNRNIKLETYDTIDDAREAYAYLCQCLALNAALCDLPTKGASKP